MSRELTRQEKAAIRSLVKRWCANYDKTDPEDDGQPWDEDGEE